MQQAVPVRADIPEGSRTEPLVADTASEYASDRR